MTVEVHVAGATVVILAKETFPLPNVILPEVLSQGPMMMLIVSSPCTAGKVFVNALVPASQALLSGGVQ